MGWASYRARFCCRTRAGGCVSTTGCGCPVLAQRFEPAKCVVLDDGTRLDLEPDGSLPPAARVVDPDGHIGTVEAA